MSFKLTIMCEYLITLLAFRSSHSGPLVPILFGNVFNPPFYEVVSILTILNFKLVIISKLFITANSYFWTGFSMFWSRFHELLCTFSIGQLDFSVVWILFKLCEKLLNEECCRTLDPWEISIFRPFLYYILPQKNAIIKRCCCRTAVLLDL